MWARRNPRAALKRWLRPWPVDRPRGWLADVHRQWGQDFDPPDYDANGLHTGARGNDNIHLARTRALGPVARATLFNHDPRWEAVGGHTLTHPLPSSAETLVVNGQSAVVLHCPNVGGASLIVRAELTPEPPGRTNLPAHTGVMSMWKRKTTKRRRALRHEVLETRQLLDAGGLLAAAEGEPLPDFSLVDVNHTSASYNQTISPRDYIGQTTAWYFGHAT